MRITRRLFATLALLAAAGPVRATPAQSPSESRPRVVTVDALVPDDRLRIGADSVSPRARTTALFVAMRGDSLVVRTGPNSAAAPLALTQIHALEVVRGRHVRGSRVGKGALVGGLIGGLTGAGIGAVLEGGCQGEDLCGLGTFLLGVGGLGVGSVIGLVWGLNPTDRWVPVALPPDERVDARTALLRREAIQASLLASSSPIALNELAPGASVRVRLRGSGPARLRGRFVDQVGDSVSYRRVGQGPSTPVALPLDQVQSMDVSRGRHTSAGRVVLGMLIGGVVAHKVSNGRYVEDLAAVAVGGLLLGWPYEEWASVSLPDR